MAITWSEDADSRQDLGIGGIIQQNTAAFSLSDYQQGGYPIYASAFGMSHIRGLWPVGYAGKGPGYPGGLVWQYLKPAVSGPSQSNPGFLVALEQGSASNYLVEASASSNFTLGNLDLIAFGY